MKSFADLKASDRVVSHGGNTVVMTSKGELFLAIPRPKLPSLLEPLYTPAQHAEHQAVKS